MIRQDATLRVDQVKLPYVELVKCLQQSIINVLVRNYNISPSEAYDRWQAAIAVKDETIAQIIDAMIHIRHEDGSMGIPLLINRNPTINYGSIQQVFCVGYTDTLTMSVSLQSLKPLAADFDGKSSILYYYNGSRNYLSVLLSLKLLNCWKSHQQLIGIINCETISSEALYKRTFNDYRKHNYREIL